MITFSSPAVAQVFADYERRNAEEQIRGAALGTELLFGSANALPFNGAQNLGSDVPSSGKEGGKTRLIPIFSAASLVSAGGSVTTVDAITGQLTTAFGPHTLYGRQRDNLVF